jgi:hypothetical protein
VTAGWLTSRHDLRHSHHAKSVVQPKYVFRLDPCRTALLWRANEESMRASSGKCGVFTAGYLFAASLVLLFIGVSLCWAWFGNRGKDGRLLSYVGIESKPLEGRRMAMALPGEPTLDCTLHDLDGRIVRLSDFRGHTPVVVEFGGFT